jgi:succinyl-diaminopimelate desuccinylase
VNATIHQIDEHCALTALGPLKDIYRRTLEAMLA